MLVDERGDEKGILDRREHKSIATDRVVLVQGPDEEVAIVREIYRQFVEDQHSERQIADWLNRSEEHTSELQSIMRISYAGFCLKKKRTKKNNKNTVKQV